MSLQMGSCVPAWGEGSVEELPVRVGFRDAQMLTTLVVSYSKITAFCVSDIYKSQRNVWVIFNIGCL